MANIGRRYSWFSDKYGYVSPDPPKPREYQELCSICDKDNYSHLENTFSPTNIFSKGFFQSSAQKALQSSQIEKAFEIAEQYIQMSKRKFYRFLDIKTKKVIISKQLNRFCRRVPADMRIFCHVFHFMLCLDLYFIVFAMFIIY